MAVWSPGSLTTREEFHECLHICIYAGDLFMLTDLQYALCYKFDDGPVSVMVGRHLILTAKYSVEWAPLFPFREMRYHQNSFGKLSKYYAIIRRSQWPPWNNGLCSISRIDLQDCIDFWTAGWVTFIISSVLRPNCLSLRGNQELSSIAHIRNLLKNYLWLTFTYCLK